MTDNVTPIFGFQMHDDQPSDFLEKAKTVPFDSVLVIGELPNGDFWFGGNSGDMKQALWLTMRALTEIQTFSQNLETE